MDHSIRQFVGSVLRLVVVWVVAVVSLLLTAAIVPGITIQNAGAMPAIAVASAAAFVIGIANLLVRPLILLLAVPLGFIAVFVTSFFANAAVLWVASAVLPGFDVHGVLNAVLGSVVLSAVNTLVISVLAINDIDSFYWGLVERLARGEPFEQADASGREFGRGLVMLEIDGLSYHHLSKALAKGWVPGLSKMMRDEGYVLTRVDCGLPSQTSACQAGIMFGDNQDIPAFRWFDKEKNKLYVSGKDAPEINARYAKGKGLMRKGSSINNMMDGDAENSLLTAADLLGGDDAERQARARDIYLLLLNPYFMMRTIILYIAEVLLELWQGWQQRVHNVQPRLDRLHGFYPFIRAAMTIFMRDISADLACIDIVRGSPSIYVTYPGYDEVAHHSGPWTSDAFGVLKRYDQVIGRVHEMVKTKATRHYELLVLSDHGQSFGATFKQRYGSDLKQFIEGLLPHGMGVAQSMGGDDGSVSMASMAAELQNIQQHAAGRVGRRVARRTQRALERGMQRRAAGKADQPATVTVCGSGNLAQVYFDLDTRKLNVDELNAAYPGMVDGLVQHEGIGFVVSYDADGTPVVFGKRGARNLHTGAVTGEDPLKPFGDAELRARQVRRIADFPHAGDLIVNSTLYADGTVAAMEELVGNHGGLGGEQTDAFVFHPADMQIPAITNSTELFGVLNARRALPAPLPQPAGAAQPAVPAWSRRSLRSGLSKPGLWLTRAARAIVLDRATYRQVANDATMTGPALLIALLAAVLASALSAGGWNLLDIAVRLGAWLFSTLILFGAARLLGGRNSFNATFRVMGFARGTYVFQLLRLVPALGPLAELLTTLASLFATWTGAAEAHRLRGWRTLVLPLLVIALAALTTKLLRWLVS